MKKACRQGEAASLFHLVQISSSVSSMNVMMYADGDRFANGVLCRSACRDGVGPAQRACPMPGPATTRRSLGQLDMDGKREAEWGRDRMRGGRNSGRGRMPEVARTNGRTSGVL
jgi:hypothetical protein